eukprot:1761113-Prymnesium_polylepis.1
MMRDGARALPPSSSRSGPTRVVGPPEFLSSPRRARLLAARSALLALLPARPHLLALGHSRRGDRYVLEAVAHVVDLARFRLLVQLAAHVQAQQQRRVQHKLVLDCDAVQLAQQVERRAEALARAADDEAYDALDRVAERRAVLHLHKVGRLEQPLAPRLLRLDPRDLRAVEGVDDEAAARR